MARNVSRLNPQENWRAAGNSGAARSSDEEVITPGFYRSDSVESERERVTIGQEQSVSCASRSNPRRNCAVREATMFVLAANLTGYGRWRERNFPSQNFRYSRPAKHRHSHLKVERIWPHERSQAQKSCPRKARTLLLFCPQDGNVKVKIQAIDSRSLITPTTATTSIPR